MKHIKTYEGLLDFLRLKYKKRKPKVGDYVIVEDNSIAGNVSDIGKEFWHNFYGIIVNTGALTHKTKNDFYLIEFLNNISIEDQEKLRIHFINTRKSIIPSGNSGNVGYSIYGIYVAPKNYMWFIKDKIKTFDSKEEWQKAVNQIELEKTAKQYNI